MTFEQLINRRRGLDISISRFVFDETAAIGGPATASFNGPRFREGTDNDSRLACRVRHRGKSVAQLSASSGGNSGVGRFCDWDFDLWSERELCGAILGKVGPNHVFIVEAARERGLHYHEVG
jgi:hypothetical protein